MRPTRDSDRLWLRVLGQPGVATLLLCTAAVLVMVGSGWAVVRVLGGARPVIPTLGPEPIIRVRIAARRQQIELTSPGPLLFTPGATIPRVLPAPVVIEPDGDGFVHASNVELYAEDDGDSDRSVLQAGAISVTPLSLKGLTVANIREISL